MKKFFVLLIITFTILSSLPTYAVSAEPPIDDILANYQQEQVWVKANAGLNIRTLPNIESEIINTVPFGTKLIRLQENIIQSWDLIFYKNNKYYVYNKYLTTTEPEYYYMGEYRITFYCGCSKCNGKWTGQPTASGVYAQDGITVASGRQFSFGTKLLIQGHIYTVQDRGVPNGCIDIYVSSHSECNRRGLYYTDVYLLKNQGKRD